MLRHSASASALLHSQAVGGRTLSGLTCNTTLSKRRKKTGPASGTSVHELNIDRKLLPSRRCSGAIKERKTNRYFADKFPMFLAQDSGSYEPLVMFTFADPCAAVRSSFLTHLTWYSGLFARLRRFNFVYVGTEQSNFATAEAGFTKRAQTAPPNAIRKLIRYFQLRELGDTKHYSKIRLTDLDFIAQAKKILLETPSTRSTTAGERTNSGTPKSVRSSTTTMGESTSTSPRFCLPRTRCTSGRTPGSTARGA